MLFHLLINPIGDSRLKLMNLIGYILSIFRLCLYSLHRLLC